MQDPTQNEPPFTETWRVLILVPAMNEEESLPKLFAELALRAPEYEILVIDDGSSDSTAQLALAAGCALLRHPFNLGYGAALTSGYRYALRHGYDVVVQVDADGQHPPCEIERLLAPIRAREAEVVIGSRYREEEAGRNPYAGSIWRRLGATVIASIARLWIRKPISDPTSGFQAMHRKALELLCHGGFPDDFPDVDVLITMHRSGLRLLEIATPMRERFAGISMHGGFAVPFYFYRLFVVLMLLPFRRHSPYRKERQELGKKVAHQRQQLRNERKLPLPSAGEIT
ncbi:MAG: glycosyl transferase family 2 [Planctomycetota bacterium]|nr:MAG: glycosyl transferase family 2 [Planctomycetota bacterium]